MTQTSLKLTEVEQEVLEWIALGKSASVIADILNVPLDDSERHISSIFKKMNASNHVEVSMVAIKLGMVRTMLCDRLN